MEMWVVVSVNQRKMIMLNHTKEICSESLDSDNLFMLPYFKPSIMMIKIWRP